MQNPEAAFNNEIKSALQGQDFPADHIPDNFFKWLTSTLRHESKVTMGCDTETFLRLRRLTFVSASVSLFEMGFVLNAMERRTLVEWDREDYDLMLVDHHSMTDKWNEIVGPIKKSIMNKIQTQVRISQGVPAGKQIIGKA